MTGENEVHALKDVSINFRNSEFVSILGPSGCGKTTLLNIIGGLDKYTSGDIVINGVSTKEYKGMESNVIFYIPSFSIYIDTCIDNGFFK